MLTSTPEVVSWPETAESLCQVLDIHGDAKLHCHGTRKARRKNEEETLCRNDISKLSKASVDKLLDKIVAQGDLDKARALLQEVASLVLCRRNHQDQTPLLVAQWEKALASAEIRHAEKNKPTQPLVTETSPVIVKEETDESTPSLTLSPPKPEDVKEASPSVTSIKCTPPPKTDTTNDPAPSSSRPPIASTPRPRRSPRNKNAQHTFEAFGKPKTTHDLNLIIKEKIRRPLLKSEVPKPDSRPGYIYMYTFAGAEHASSPLVKVGRTLDVAARIKNWRGSCGYEPLVLKEVAMPMHVKVEKLAHAQLWNERMRDSGCPGCGVKHREWFDVDSKEAARVIDMWTNWSLRGPYDEFGQLKRYWVVRLEQIDLDDPLCWEWFVDEVS